MSKVTLFLLVGLISISFGQSSRSIRPNFFHSEQFVAFSDSLDKDLFSLTATGADTLNARIIFSITAPGGTIIYSDSLESANFCGTGADPNHLHDSLSTRAGRASLLMQKLQGFFLASHFDSPAVRFDTVRDAPYPVFEVWNEFRNNSNIVGFRYSKDIDLEVGIGYSRIQKKVVRYFAIP
jgi:hypothetical protein